MTSNLVTISTGNWQDYRALAHHHRRAAPPATHTLILTARTIDHLSREILVGVLVISMPTLNGAWRQLAWPGRYCSSDKRRDTRTINQELRCISRVIVKPTYRGRGLAAALVRTYLRNPLSPCTEAVTRTTASRAFFERAGMTRYLLPPPIPDARLLDAAASIADHAAVSHRHPLLARERQIWARHSPSTHHDDNHSDDDLRTLAKLNVTPIVQAFAYTVPN